MSAMVKTGNESSFNQTCRVVGRKRIPSNAFSNDTENHTTRNETPYTPVHEDTWMSGNKRCWELPSRFHGKPLNIRATIISSATQARAQNSANPVRTSQFSGLDVLSTRRPHSHAQAAG